MLDRSNKVEKWGSLHLSVWVLKFRYLREYKMFTLVCSASQNLLDTLENLEVSREGLDPNYFFDEKNGAT